MLARPFDPILGNTIIFKLLNTLNLQLHSAKWKIADICDWIISH